MAGALEAGVLTPLPGQPPGQQPGAPLTWRRRSRRGPRRRSPPGRGRWAAGSSGTGTSRSSAARERVRGGSARRLGRGGLVRPPRARSPAPTLTQTTCRSLQRPGMWERQGTARRPPQSCCGAWAPLPPGFSGGQAGAEGGPPGLARRALPPTAPPWVPGGFSSLHTRGPRSRVPSGG